MCGSNSDQALGMPQGSVRAILSMIIVPIIIISGSVLMFFFFFAGEYSSSLGIFSGLIGIAGIIVGYYFGAKSAEKSIKEIINSHNITNLAKEEIINNHKMINEQQRSIIVNKDREIDILNRNVLINNMV